MGFGCKPVILCGLSCGFGVSLSDRGKAKTHSGLKNIFNELFIKTGKLNITSGELYEILYNSRHDADYADFVTFEEAEIKPLIEETKAFLVEVRKHISV